MMQGIFGIILSTIANIASNSSENIEQIRKKISNSKFAILIVSFIIYVILSGGKNLYRLETLRIYSPMTSTFMEYILNPLYNIYYFASGNDFLHNGKSNWAFFIMNFIISLFVTFFGFVYNEFLILFCCGLERNTHSQVIKRADDEKDFNLIQNGEVNALATISVQYRKLPNGTGAIFFRSATKHNLKPMDKV
ncbi:MAG: hypothetical protein II453_01130, partial [Alphaproteobacteria bacterium]|nr:hypothetical protein [Alphaproteobacteria bacterium]